MSFIEPLNALMMNYYYALVNHIICNWYDSFHWIEI